MKVRVTALALFAQFAFAQIVLPVEDQARLAMAHKDYRKALDIYHSIDKPSPLVLNMIGMAYLSINDLKNAKKYYQRAVKDRPNYSEAINNLGAVFYAERNYRRAITEYEKAIKLAPNSALYHSNLGTAWYMRKDFAKMTEYYRRALALDSTVFESKGSYDGSLIQQSSIEEKAKYFFYLCKTYANAGMIPQALQNMRKALENGFKDRKHFTEDAEFASLQELPEFKELLAYQPRVL
jgi:tetratricopeptide (TPR) repeat protein